MQPTLQSLNAATQLVTHFLRGLGNTLSYQAGKPDGTKELCGFLETYCKEGYVTNGTHPILRIMTNAKLAIVTDDSTNKKFWLHDCLDPKKVFNSIQSALAASSTGPSPECAVTSPTWDNTYAIAEISAINGYDGLTSETCESVTSAYAALAQNCETDSAEASAFIDWVKDHGAVLGVVGALLVTCCVTTACINKFKMCRNTAPSGTVYGILAHNQANHQHQTPLITPNTDSKAFDTHTNKSHQTPVDAFKLSARTRMSAKTLQQGKP
jgi:hypothetical protein